MHKIRIELSERSYPVLIENGLTSHIGERLSKFNLNRRLALISGEHVSPLYRESVENSLKNAGYDVIFYCMPSGEANKNMATVQGIYDAMLDLKLDRSSSIIALGGGVIGDTAGFAAATIFRGISLIQVPTTLLSQVDSAIGGKVGINHPRGKNLIGAIYQPRTVLIDPSVLSTLDYRQRVSGYAEIIKYGLIRDPILFDFLIRENRSILHLQNMDHVLNAVSRAVEIKGAVISQDEFESDLRMILNFGHTLGHAIENTAGYGVFTHGEAILVGMIAAAKLSVDYAGLGEDIFQRIKGDIQTLPVNPPLKDLDKDAMMEAMTRDKKVKNGKIRFILLKNIGETLVRDDIPAEAISEVIDMVKELKFAPL